jgi:hypothetical protein
VQTGRIQTQVHFCKQKVFVAFILTLRSSHASCSFRYSSHRLGCAFSVRSSLLPECASNDS